MAAIVSYDVSVMGIYVYGPMRHPSLVAHINVSEASLAGQLRLAVLDSLGPRTGSRGGLNVRWHHALSSMIDTVPDERV